MKYKILVGSLSFEQGTFQKGDIIEVSEERAKLFDKHDIETAETAALAVSKPAEEVKPVAVEPPVVQEAAPVSWGASKKKPAKTATV